MTRIQNWLVDEVHFQHLYYVNMKYDLSLHFVVICFTSTSGVYRIYPIRCSIFIFPLFFSPFLFPPKKRGKKKRTMNSKNLGQNSCLSARSYIIVCFPLPLFPFILQGKFRIHVGYMYAPYAPPCTRFWLQHLLQNYFCFIFDCLEHFHNWNLTRGQKNFVKLIYNLIYKFWYCYIE